MHPHNDDATVNRLVNENIRLAYYLARKFAWISDFSEALSLAQEGLLSAAQRWRPEDGAFGTYAGNKMRWTIIRDYKKSLAMKRGGVGVEGKRRRASTISLNAPVGNDSDWNRTFGEVVADENAALPGEEMGLTEEIQETREIAQALLGLLSPRNRSIVEKRFGFAGRQPMILEDIAAGYGLTRERVRQIIDESQRTLWRALDRKKLEPVKIDREQYVA